MDDPGCHALGAIFRGLRSPGELEGRLQQGEAQILLVHGCRFCVHGEILFEHGLDLFQCTASLSVSAHFDRKYGYKPLRGGRFAGSGDEALPHQPVADKKGGRDTFDAHSQGLSTEVIDQIPLSPRLQGLERLPEQELVPLFEQRQRAQLRALDPFDKVCLAAAGEQHTVVEADLLLGLQTAVVDVDLGRLGRLDHDSFGARNGHLTFSVTSAALSSCLSTKRL